MQDMGIVDVWRDLYPSGWDFPHFSYPHSVYSQIDYLFMYNTERHRITCCKIGIIDISGHRPLYLTVDLNHTLLKFNSRILNSPPIQKAIEKEIQAYLDLNDTGEVEPPMLWDVFKAVMRGNIIARSAPIKKPWQKRLKKLQSKLKELQRQHKDDKDSNTQQQLKIVKKEIDEIYT